MAGAGLTSASADARGAGHLDQRQTRENLLARALIIHESFNRTTKPYSLRDVIFCRVSGILSLGRPGRSTARRRRRVLFLRRVEDSTTSSFNVAGVAQAGRRGLRRAGRVRLRRCHRPTVGGAPAFVGSGQLISALPSSTSGDYGDDLQVTSPKQRSAPDQGLNAVGDGVLLRGGVRH